MYQAWLEELRIGKTSMCWDINGLESRTIFPMEMGACVEGERVGAIDETHVGRQCTVTRDG